MHFALCGWAARGNVAREKIWREADKLLLQRVAYRNRRMNLNVRYNRLDDHVTQVADRTRVGGRLRLVMVPDHAQRRPQQQRQDRYRQSQTPDSL